MNGPNRGEQPRAKTLEKKRKKIDRHLRAFNPPLDKFVTEDVSKELWSLADVAKVFPDYTPTQLSDIESHYTVVLTILTWIVWPIDSTSFARHFLEAENRTDEDLPLSESLDFLGEHEFQFRETQMMFKPCVVMTETMNIIVYPANRPWPFEDLESISQGSGGEIYKATIAPKYLSRAKHFTNDKPEVLAYKKFHKAADSEIQNQAYLRASISEHPHVQLHLAAILHGDELCIFLPWTPLGDLEVLLHGGHDPAAETTTLGTTKYEFAERFPNVNEIHFIDQLRKLADALKYLHHKLVLSDTSAQHFYCAHNDLRPRNILVYEDVDSPVGKWMIADFGISSFGLADDITDTLPPRFDYPAVGDLTKAKPENDARRVGPHFAPELHPNSPRKADPRQCDVWSFGCICSDILAFVVGGLTHSPEIAVVEAVRQLREFRKYKSSDDDYFYQFPSAEIENCGGPIDARLRPEVSNWLERLEREVQGSPDCSWVADITTLVRDILVIDPAQRITARDVTRRLEEILRSMQALSISPPLKLSRVATLQRLHTPQQTHSTDSLDTTTTGPSESGSSPGSSYGLADPTLTSQPRTHSRAVERSQESSASRSRERSFGISNTRRSPYSLGNQTPTTDPSLRQTIMSTPHSPSNEKPFVHTFQLLSGKTVKCCAISPTADKVAYLLHDNNRLKRWYVKVYDTETTSVGTTLPALPDGISWAKDCTRLRIASSHVTISGLNRYDIRESFQTTVGGIRWQSESCSLKLPLNERRSCDIIPSTQGRFALISHNTIHLRDPQMPNSTLKLSRQHSSLWNKCFTANGAFLISWWWKTSGGNDNAIEHEICFWDVQDRKKKPDRFTFPVDARRNSEKWSLLPAASRAACMFSFEPSEQYFYLEATWGKSKMRATPVPKTSLFNSLPVACQDIWGLSVVPKQRERFLDRFKSEYEIREAYFSVNEDTFNVYDEQVIPHPLAHNAYHVAVSNLEGEAQRRIAVLASDAGELIVIKIPSRGTKREAWDSMTSQSHDFATTGLGPMDLDSHHRI